MSDQKNVTETIDTPFSTTVTVTKLRKLVRSKYGTVLLFLIAIAESLLPLPILTDPFLVTSVMMNRARAVYLVFVTTLSSVIGGVLAYFVAYNFRDFLFSLLSPEMIVTLDSFLAGGQDTFVLTIIGAVTPIPYTVVAWTVALSDGNLLVFIIASVIGRSIRYSIVGWSTYKFGPAALRYAQHSIFITSIIIFIFVGLYIWLKL